MLGAFFGFFRFLGGIFSWFGKRKAQQEGRMKERLEGNEKVLENVDKANRAESVPDVERTERLRNKWDRDRQ